MNWRISHQGYNGDMGALSPMCSQIQFYIQQYLLRCLRIWLIKPEPYVPFISWESNKSFWWIGSIDCVDVLWADHAAVLNILKNGFDHQLILGEFGAITGQACKAFQGTFILIQVINKGNKIPFAILNRGHSSSTEAFSLLFFYCCDAVRVHKQNRCGYLLLFCF